MRQVTEAYEIQKNSRKNPLNRRGEWGQNLPPRLNLEEDGENQESRKRKKKTQIGKEEHGEHDRKKEEGSLREGRQEGKKKKRVEAEEPLPLSSSPRQKTMRQMIREMSDRAKDGKTGNLICPLPLSSRRNLNSNTTHENSRPENNIISPRISEGARSIRTCHKNENVKSNFSFSIRNRANKSESAGNGSDILVYKEDLCMKSSPFDYYQQIIQTTISEEDPGQVHDK